MGQLDNLPESNSTGNSAATEALLRAMNQELENLKQNLIVQLNKDVEQLQAEKSQLLNEIRSLQVQRQQFSSPVNSASQLQTEQQQYLVKQITQALATQLEAALMQQISQQSANSYPPLSGATGINLNPAPAVSDYNEDAYRLLVSLDTTLRTTFKTLQQDISSYQSSFSQQLGRMHSLEQQGEAILEALVSRLKDQLQADASAEAQTRLPIAPTQSGEVGITDIKGSPQKQSAQIPAVVIPTTTPAAVPLTPSKPKPSAIQLGLFLALFSSAALSLYNVSLKILLKGKAPRSILSLFQLEGLISPSVGNSLLILLMRMVVVLLLMPILATILYPPVWKDLRRFIKSKDWSLFLQVVGSGFFLFLSQVLIYIAIGQIPTGVAITIFFIYPIVTGMLAWRLFGDRPSLFRIGVMFVIILGGILALPQGAGPAGDVVLGNSAAAGAGITFAGYVILTQICGKKLHPIPFSLINFASIFVLCCLSLMLPLPADPKWAVQVNPAVWPSLTIGGLILGAITLTGYLLNNFSIRLAGAALSSIVGATGPALTALFAFIIIQETLKAQQVLGMVFVTLGVLGLSLERMRRQKQATPATSPSTPAKNR